MTNRRHKSVAIPLLLAAAASWATFHELQAVNSTTGWNGVNPLHPGWSLRSVHNALAQCDLQQAFAYAAFRTSKENARTNAACRDLAHEVLATMPRHGFARYVAAMSSTGQEQNQQLALSQRFAPHEGWLAERRFVFAANSDALWHLEIVNADIGVLLTTQSGAELLVRYYDRRPQLRDAIRAHLKTASSGIETRFLNLLRQRVAS